MTPKRKSPSRRTAPPLASPKRSRPVTCSPVPHHVGLARCKAELPPPSKVRASEGFPPESSATAFPSPDTLLRTRPSPAHKIFKGVHIRGYAFDTKRDGRRQQGLCVPPSSRPHVLSRGRAGLAEAPSQVGDRPDRLLPAAADPSLGVCRPYPHGCLGTWLEGENG